MLQVSEYLMFSWDIVTPIISLVPRRVLSDISNGLEIQILTLMVYICDEKRLTYTYASVCIHSKASNATVLTQLSFTNSMKTLRKTELLNATMRCSVLFRNIWFAEFAPCDSCIDYCRWRVLVDHLIAVKLFITSPLCFC